MRSCFSLLGSAILIAVIAVVAWFNRDDISRFASSVLNRNQPEVELAAPEAADHASRAEAKIVALGRGEVGEVTLSAEEMNGWIQHGLAGFFPDFVSHVTAAIAEDERLVLDGRLVVEKVPGIERLGPMAMLLGDTANVVVQGRLDGLEPGRGVFYVDRIQIAALPLPDAMRDQLMAQIRGATSDGMPVNAVTFELPLFVTDIGIRAGALFLRSSALDPG